MAGGCNNAKTETAASIETKDLPSDAVLCDRLDQVIDFTVQNRHLNTKDHAAWQVVHGLIVYGHQFPLDVDGKGVMALDYLLHDGQLTGWNLYPTEHGVGTKVEAGTKTGQGHDDQWLGYLAQCGVTPDEQLIVNGQSYTVNESLPKPNGICTTASRPVGP